MTSIISVNDYNNFAHKLPPRPNAYDGADINQYTCTPFVMYACDRLHIKQNERWLDEWMLPNKLTHVNEAELTEILCHNGTYVFYYSGSFQLYLVLQVYDDTVNAYSFYNNSGSFGKINYVKPELKHHLYNKEYFIQQFCKGCNNNINKLWNLLEITKNPYREMIINEKWPVTYGYIE
jgi:hypothetical protein